MPGRRHASLSRAGLALVAFLLVAVSLGAGGSPARVDRGAACKPGTRSIGGVQVRVFCGPAKAAVHVGGKTLTFKNGQCEKGAQYLVVNIGTVVLDVTASQKFDYFGLVIGREPVFAPQESPAAKDGAYTGGLVTMNFAGVGYLLQGKPTITLKKGRSTGIFSGQLFVTSKPISGTFTC